MRGAARRGGLRPGDCIVALNGRRAEDVLDLEIATADEVVWLRVLREGRLLDLAIRIRADEGHGIALAHGLGVRPRVCRNRCRFCFVDQLPPGLRPSLYVKDDDYRLSFLQGTFITLTNLTQRDVERIVELRLSPLYVSLHAWDDEARIALMGSAARSSTRVLQLLAARGVEIHVQIVLCPGWNDGPVLAETVQRLADVAGVRDVGIVPVSLAAAGDLRRVTPADAEKIVAAVEAWQAGFVRTLGRAFVHAADEIYLLCRRLPPASDAELQYENGIGVSAHTLSEAARVAAGLRHGGRSLPMIRLLGGRLAEPVLQAACDSLTEVGVRCRILRVENELFGPHVSVAGLLGGREIVAALRVDPLEPQEWLAVPRDVLPAPLERTLDDVSRTDLVAACEGRLVVEDGLEGAFATLAR